MKIIDQYIFAIGQKLPVKGREDVKEELKSLLLDDIEARFGKEPTESDVRQAISDFGSPGKVAGRYSGSRQVVAAGFTDLYFLIFKIIIFAMAVAGLTLFFIDLFTRDPAGPELLKSMGESVLTFWDSSLSGIGMLTVIFIIITRFMKEKGVDLEENWNPSELKGIKLDDEAESKFGSFFAIFFLLILLLIMNMFPQLMSLAESSFEKSGMILGSRIDMDRMAAYILFLSLVWIGEIVYHILVLKIVVRNRALSLYKLGLEIGGLIILGAMVLDNSLFVANPQATMPSVIGFKAVFILVLGISIFELLVRAAKKIYRKYANSL